METEYEEVALRQSSCSCCGVCVFVVVIVVVVVVVVFFVFVYFRELLSDSQPWRKVCRQRNSLGALSPQLKRQ